MKVRQNIQKYTPCNHLKLETALENNLKLCRKYTACSTSRYLPTVDCWFSRKYNIYIFGHKEKLLNSPLLDTLVHCKTRSIITQQTIGNQTKSGKSDYWKIDTKKKEQYFISELIGKLVFPRFPQYKAPYHLIPKWFTSTCLSISFSRKCRYLLHIISLPLQGDQSQRLRFQIEGTHKSKSI